MGLTETLERLKAQESAVAYFEAQIEAMKVARRTTLADLEKLLPAGGYMKTSEGLKRVMPGNGGLVLRKVSEAKGEVTDVSGVL